MLWVYCHDKYFTFSLQEATLDMRFWRLRQNLYLVVNTYNKTWQKDKRIEGYNKHVKRILNHTTSKYKQVKCGEEKTRLGGHHSISRGGEGGGTGVFVASKLFISTGLKISHFITCLNGAVLEVNYLFHAMSARNYLFQKNSNLFFKLTQIKNNDFMYIYIYYI